MFFQARLADNIFELQKDLRNKMYTHGGYEEFKIDDPKPRLIHKATVRDRLLHHLIHHELYPYFDKKFIFHSYSCRNEKGTHKAMHYFKGMTDTSRSKAMWVLKCDIRKFFASIDHSILKEILARHIEDKDLLNLLGNIIDSFSARQGLAEGLPLGNLTSQLLVNIYMNEFDQFVKHELKEKYYIRYADDFVFLSQDKYHLEQLIPKISEFLETKLKLSLHPDKVFIKAIHSGVDFLGWVHFFNHKILRTSTKNRMFKKLKDNPKEEVIVSYQGLLSHGNTSKLSRKAGLADL